MASDCLAVRWGAVLVGLLCSWAGSGCSAKSHTMPLMIASYLNQPLPELPEGGNWINSARPITLQSLRGKVVWIEFSFLS